MTNRNLVIPKPSHPSIMVIRFGDRIKIIIDEINIETM